jgi:hypothetical protein
MYPENDATSAPTHSFDTLVHLLKQSSPHLPSPNFYLLRTPFASDAETPTTPIPNCYLLSSLASQARAQSTPLIRGYVKGLSIHSHAVTKEDQSPSAVSREEMAA